MSGFPFSLVTMKLATFRYSAVFSYLEAVFLRSFSFNVLGKVKQFTVQSIIYRAAAELQADMRLPAVSWTNVV